MKKYKTFGLVMLFLTSIYTSTIVTLVFLNKKKIDYLYDKELYGEGKKLVE